MAVIVFALVLLRLLILLPMLLDRPVWGLGESMPSLVDAALALVFSPRSTSLKFSLERCWSCSEILWARMRMLKKDSRWITLHRTSQMGISTAFMRELTRERNK